MQTQNITTTFIINMYHNTANNIIIDYTKPTLPIPMIREVKLHKIFK